MYGSILVCRISKTDQNNKIDGLSHSRLIYSNIYIISLIFEYQYGYPYIPYEVNVIN